eukprot:325012_1
MLLKEAVRFRCLASQLTSEETNRFLSNLSHQQPMLLISALYKHFLSDGNMTQTISSNISEIISSRKPKPQLESSEPPTDPTPKLVHFNDVPNSVISIISSFMNQSDYTHFSKINRFTFLGCHSPNTLQAVSFHSFAHFKHQLYPNVTRLRFKLCQLPRKLYEPFLSFFNQLEWIHVVGTPTDDKINFWSFQGIPCDNVKQLACSCMNGPTCTTYSMVESIISQCPKIECLSLHKCTKVDGNTISSMSSLKGLSIQMNNKHLIPILADKLEFLELNSSTTWHHSSEEVYELHDINFSKLEQLKLCGVNSTSTNCLDHIIKTADNLKKLSISGAAVDFVSISTMQQAMERCTCLEYIKIEAIFINTPHDALIGIANGLTAAKKKRTLKIEVVSSPDMVEQSCSDDLVQCVLSLINALKSKTKHFMFIWRLNYRHMTYTQENIQLAQQLKNNLNDSVMIKVTSWGPNVTIVVMNRNCAINGYQASWICQSLY